MISALLCTAPLVQGQTHPPVYYHHPEMSQKVVFPAPETGSRGYDVQSYDLELVLDPSVQTVSGRVNIGLLALDNNLRQIHLDLTENMQCLQIDFNHTAVMFSHLADSLMVTLPRDLSLTTCDTLTVYYQGRPLPHGSFYAGLMFRKHDSGTPDNDGDDAPIIASVSETWSAHSWWPCKDHPSDKALISIKATVPDTLSLVSNGTLEGSYLERPGWQTYAWRERHPLPTYLVSVAASNYRSWHEDCLLTSAVGSDQNIPLGFHVFPQQEPEALIDFQNTCEALQFMVDLAGPYPYEGEKYDQATIRWAGAMEHATATSLPEYFFTGNNQYENFLVHEIAHHWFGNNLTCGRWSDIWLNEGFARYCEALWIEHNQGHAAYAQYMYTIGPVIHENLFVGDGFLADPNPILPNFMVYDKGAWVLHSLRTLLGDEVFFSILANYAQDTQLQHGNSETRDFIRHAENRSGLNLDTFFTPWLYTETVAQLAHKIDYPGGFSSGTV
ncbi:MAG: M1 family metallopeptidase [bacterium]|nr:M1 family metallopeptidase [bacterium]